MKHVVLASLLAITLLFTSPVRAAAPDAAYYDSLRETCARIVPEGWLGDFLAFSGRTKGRDSCCMVSIDAMEYAQGWEKKDNALCPEGSGPNMIRCGTTGKVWCEPVKKEKMP
jgi:hypothetical protein